VPSDCEVIGISLHTALHKIIATNVMTVLTTNNGDNATSGVAMLHEMSGSTTMIDNPKSLWEDYKSFMSIQRNTNEDIMTYTSPAHHIYTISG